MLAENLAWCQNSTVFLVVLSALFRKFIWGVPAAQDGAWFPDGPSEEAELSTIPRQFVFDMS